MTLPRTLVAASFLAFFPNFQIVAQEGAGTPVWELDGFGAPESALVDAARDVLYVSNIAGEPTGKDGVGYISRVSVDGKMIEAEWVTGLNGPKGLVLVDSTLYVSDIDRLVAIDVEAGEVSGTWQAEGAKFLNDTAVDGDGRVFVSDMVTNAIYVLDGDILSVWLSDEALQHPNGLKIDNRKLVVAAWGQDLREDFSTRVPGHLITVDLGTKEIAALGSGEPVGNLDGLELDGEGNWRATDWIAGALLRIRPDGSFDKLLDLDMGSADLEYQEADRVAIVPMMLNNRIAAYRLD